MDSQAASTLVVREVEDHKEQKDVIGKVVSDSATANIDTEPKKSSSRAEPKKTVVLEVESSSDSDSSTESSESSDTEAAKKQKKREAAKAIKHARNKKAKKPVKAQTDSDSDSDSGSASDSNSGSDSFSGSSSEAVAAVSSEFIWDPARAHLPLQRQLHHQPPSQQIFSSHQFYQPYGYYTPPVTPMGSPVGFNAGVSLSDMPADQPPPPDQPTIARGQFTGLHLPPGMRERPGRDRLGLPNGILDNEQLENRHRRSKKSKRKSKSTTFKRVDQIWDNTIRDFKLQDTAEGSTDAEYEGYAFHVRRILDWEGRYKQTLVDIKSKILRNALQDVMGDIKGASLVEETPKLDPNFLYLYLEDMRKYLKSLKTAEPKGDKKARKKEAKRNVKKREQLKALVEYLDKDYESVKNSLRPLLDNGLITFDLLWALWKPNTLAFTTTYGSHDLPRVFRVDMAERHCSVMNGEFYCIAGNSFEYDGKRFGYGRVADEIGEFGGARKITSLAIYPLKYHKKEERLREELIDRGKKFVALSGAQYRSYDGMAYYKHKKTIVKVSITGRIMIDASLHRRTNPNYPISLVRPNDNDSPSDDERAAAQQTDSGSYTPSSRLVMKKKDYNDLDQVPEFSDEEYLMASPIVLGFAFAEKLWLEFSVSSVKEIQWDHDAYGSLVLEPKTKDIVKSLVESHRYHAAESIDDVIQGKGKGLVAVLHGPPGTGKTLTAESISELLQCPLYMVSAGELGTDSRHLESELQKILDICHAWGAILLLDEADVFLEKRNMHELHRNALVSIFLRQLEYFQGILFLTTNRVETFDDAFQSRIHIALRYDSLDCHAKKAIFKIFVERVRVLEKIDLKPFTEEDYATLAYHDLNGRQIKNTVRTAQALAVNKGEPMSMAHIQQVLNVQMSFDRDLKGGPGFQDAMRSYF